MLFDVEVLRRLSIEQLTYFKDALIRLSEETELTPAYLPEELQRFSESLRSLDQTG